MRRSHIKSPAAVTAVLLSLSLGGCNAAGITGEDENEVRVTVVALGANSLDGNDGHSYAVTSDTEYEGLSGFADIAVGDTVEIEWESVSGGDRRALEIEAGSHDDAGDD